MDQVARNVRFLLWRAGVSRDAWADELAAWVGRDRVRAAAVLRDGTDDADELAALARRTGTSPEEIRFADLVGAGRVDVLRENLKFLTDRLRRGEKGPLAAALRVHPSTLSKWRSGDQKPGRGALRRLAERLGLGPDVDLAADPVFLDPRPAGEAERRAWLRRRIDGLDGAELAALFPALERLLGER